MRPLIAGASLGVLFFISSGLVWFTAGSAGAAAVFAGGILPITISICSLFIFSILKPDTGGHKKYQRFILANFLVKVVLIGLWTALVLLAIHLPREPFIASLLINFFAWHVYEAYRYQQQFKTAQHSTAGMP
ncbi:MAG: hypothetical protein JSU77_00310 [Fidelibacterota bacterium]|nr:MAG: hypothetical protein JSU77_00310 [Candidatus Neomarinimicrobiota bacterium]